MTTTTLTLHEHNKLKADNASWPVAWDHGQWVEREDTMVFLVKEKPRAFLPKEDFGALAARGSQDESRRR